MKPGMIVVLSLFIFGSIGRAAETTNFDAAPFGFPLEQDEGGKAAGIRWAEPRKIRQVVVEFADAKAAPEPSRVKLQYWQRIWNGKPDPILAEAGAGHVGWHAVDDWTNGEWKDADTELQAKDSRWTFTFKPTGAKEFADLGHPGVSYRKTLKLRLLSEEKLPKPARLKTVTDAVLRPLAVRVLWGAPADKKIQVDADEKCPFEVFNGSVSRIEHQAGAIEADLLMAVDSVDGRYDRTIVTVRSKTRPFSFAADEVARGDRILIDDLGVLVVRGDDTISLEGYRQARKEFAGPGVYQRVFDESEQTLERSWNDMPLKRPLWFVHGLPGNRNVVRQFPNGQLEISSRGRWFQIHSSTRDSDLKKWEGGVLRLGFGLPDGDPDGRELLDGYLPMLRTWWQVGPIFYEESTVMDKLDGDLGAVALDDPTLVLVRIHMVNTSSIEPATAQLRFAAKAEDKTESLILKEDGVYAKTDGDPRFRYLVKTGGGETRADGDSVRWTMSLDAGKSHDVYLFVPTITLSGDEEIAKLRERDFTADSQRIGAFWKQLTDRGSQIETPEPWLNGFYKAHLRHLLVNCYKEIGSDRLHAHVGTLHYGVYPDESAMMISDLDRRGYHREAGQCLDSFLHYQGTKEMPGNFKSKEGLFYGSGGHETGGYNKSHGWVMWLMAEHWWLTRDREWMEKAAPKLVASCDWVTRERQATMGKTADGRRPLEYGFLPSGSLEDVTDYWHWMVTNACTVWGFRTLAAALADFGHPEAARLQAEAKGFYDDVMRGLNESRILAPVIKLRNGTYVPKYPSRLYERGRSHGWLRETLEGSIHLLITGLIDPDAPEAKWILEDYEDNLYISPDYGYAIPSFDSFWFSRGGFSMQANLLGGPLPYLYRDEIKHYLRAYFNSLTSAFYPDIRMCNEHSLPELGYPAGDHFKSSDEAQSTYWLRLMFVHEKGDELYLGQAIPRDWLRPGRNVGIERASTHFGELSLRYSAEPAKIKAVLTPPQLKAPQQIYLRFRHPENKPIKRVTVNGKAYDQFDAAKEWVKLAGDLTDQQQIVAEY